MELTVLTEKYFKLFNAVDIPSLFGIDARDLRILLPSLARMSLYPPLSESKNKDIQSDLLLLLSNFKEVNNIVELLSVDFPLLREDLIKEQKIRSKTNENGKNLLSIKHGLIQDFERGDCLRKFYVVISELLPLITLLEDSNFNPTTDKNGFAISSEIFMCPMYLHVVSDVICIAHAELTSLLPMTRLAETLVYMENGPKILCKLVANFPDTFFPVCRHLIEQNRGDASGKNESKLKQIDENRKIAIEMLCSMNRDMALNVRSFTVQFCQLPSLAVSLTLDYPQNSSSRVSDLVTFISGLLLGNNVKTRSWFALYVKTAPEDSRLRVKLVEELHFIVDNASVDSVMKDVSTDSEIGLDEDMCLLNEEQCLRATALIRLCCALRAISGLKFSKKESDLVLRLITCYPPLTAAGICFMSLALSMLLACSSIIADHEKEAIAIKWIKWLASRSTEMQQAGPEGGSFAEQLLLLAIHLHNDSRLAVIQLICATLGMRVKVSSGSLARLRQIFTEEVFTTQVVAAHAATVPVTDNLNALMTGYLPIHCVYQLLKSRAFSKSKVSIKSWVYKQICSASMPLHSQLPQLVTQYVSTIVTPHTKGHKGGMLNDPLTEDEIRSVFLHGIDDKKHNLTSQLLILYYVLLYQDSLLTNMKTLVTFENAPQLYPSSLLNEIPVKLLLYYAQKYPTSCDELYPALLGLLINQLPQLCQVEDWIMNLTTIPNVQSSSTRAAVTGSHFFEFHKTENESLQKNLCTPKLLHKGLLHADVNPALSLSYLRELADEKLNPDKTMKYAKALTAGLPKLLNPKVSRRVRQEATKLWLRMNALIPRKMWVLTANALRPNTIATGIGHAHDVTLDELIEDPLILLACDERVFRCPEILSIVLRILNACLAASRAHFSTLVQASPSVVKAPSPVPSTTSGRTTPSSQVSDAEKEELRTALVAAQDSAAIQMLIESCLTLVEDWNEANMINEKNEKRCSNDDENLNLLTSLREVRCLVCSMIHQMFIADTTVAKLVHFQGYPSSLIPVLVSGVPSMHICMDFIPELLQQPDIGKKMFAIELCSNICQHYPLPKSLSLAKLCLNVLGTLVTVVSIPQRCSYFTSALSPMRRFAFAFQPLVQDIVAILLHLSRLCETFLSCQETVSITHSLNDNQSAFNFKDSHVKLRKEVRKTFEDISRHCVYK